MYPITEETAAWRKAAENNPELWNLGPCHRSLMCMALDRTLQGAAFIGEGYDWKRDQGTTYSIPVPRHDVLDAVYADTEGHNPRLHFAHNDITVPIAFGEELGLPTLALGKDDVRLLVDSVPLGDSAESLPSVRLRMASLTHEGRSVLFVCPAPWRQWICLDGLLTRIVTLGRPSDYCASEGSP